MMPRQIWKRITLGAGVGFVYVALLVTTASYLCAQEKPAANPAQPADSSQPAQRDYRFEVASIRPVDGNHRTRPHFDPGLYREEQAPLGGLVGEAFGIKRGYEIKTLSWMDTEYFTINATPPEGATNADVPIMLRHLLEDRFALKYHHETRQMSGYELVVVKSGLGLTKSPVPASQRPTVTGPPIEIGKDGMPHLSKDAGSNELRIGANAEWRGRNETMKQMADQLVNKLGAPVMDATGLEGEYDFTLLYTPEAVRVFSLPSSPATPNPTAGGDEASAPMEHPLLRDALREQLGLELKPVKNISFDVVIIDSANKVPTEN